MPRPETKVEVAFNVGFTGTPTWTDVTQRVQVDPGIEISHWRDEEDDEAQPSRCTFVLLNNDGRFTPENTSSVYYPNVKRNRPVRVTSTHNGVTYTRFRGYIDDWASEWPATVGTINFAYVSASSRMSRLARGTELRSIIEEEYLLDAPFAYWPMGEPEGSTTVGNVSDDPDATSLFVNGTGTAPTFGTADGPLTDGLTAVSFAGGKYLENMTPLPTGVIGLELFIRKETVPGAARVVAAASDGTNWVALIIDNVGGVGLEGNGAASFSSSVTVAGSGTYHHVYWDMVNADLYVDGAVDVTATGTLAITNPSIVTVGGWRGDVDHGTPIAHLDGSNGVAHVAVHTADPGTPRKLAHYQAGTTGFADETSADRIERYAGYAGVPLTDVSTEGSTPVAHFDITGMTALDAMRRVETLEGGALFDALDGTLTFHDRDRRYTATSSFTLDYDAGDIDTAGIRPVLDDQQQTNDMTATNVSATPIVGHVFDQTSIDDNGLYRDSVDLVTTDPDEPVERAGWVVNRYAEPITRISDLPVLLDKADTTVAAGVLSARLGTKCTVISLPANAPSATMVLFVEGRTDRITGNDDRVVLRTSPASLWDVFTFGSSTLGIIGTTPLGY